MIKHDEVQIFYYEDLYAQDWWLLVTKDSAKKKVKKQLFHQPGSILFKGKPKYHDNEPM